MQLSLAGSIAALAFTACTTIGDAPAADPPDAPRPTPDAATPDAGTTDAAETNALASCAASTDCISTPSLGALSGDADSAPLVFTGSRAAWFRLRVTENDTTPIGHPLRLLATLAAPPGSHWQVLLYVNPAVDTPECVVSTGSPITLGDSQQVLATWGEGVVSDNADDSRDVAIEIRAGDPSCPATEAWHLTLQGNPPTPSGPGAPAGR